MGMSLRRQPCFYRPYLTDMVFSEDTLRRAGTGIFFQRHPSICFAGNAWRARIANWVMVIVPCSMVTVLQTVLYNSTDSLGIVCLDYV